MKNKDDVRKFGKTSSSVLNNKLWVYEINVGLTVL